MDKAEALALSSDKVLSKLETSERGLSRVEVEARLHTYGPNALTASRNDALRVLARQFTSSLVYFLIVAAILAFAVGDISDGVIITAILLINATLGFTQEYRSERTVEQLSKLITRRAAVTREGVCAPVDVAELVPGDIVVLKEGDVVPADAKLLSADGVEVDESPLTGESAAVAKDAAASGDATLLYAGSIVQAGEATAVVYATGKTTELGRVATLATGVHRVTQYERSLQAFSTLLIRIILLTLALVFVAKVAIAGISNVAELFLFIIALAIAVVPEALPVIATVTLSRGALQLSKEQVVVKRLPALEDLGNVTLLCTDKTGTLTQDRMTVEKTVTDDVALFQTLAYAAAQEVEGRGGLPPSSLDVALLASIPDDVKAQAASFHTLKEVPFDPSARRRRVIVEDTRTQQQYLVVIGSAETLLDLARCTRTEEYRQQIAAEGEEGLRHLALAYTKVQYTDDDFDVAQYERDLQFLGFVALSDPLRPSAQATIQLAEQLGVGIKMLTGDSPAVAGYVGRQIGLVKEGERIYTGDDVAAMTPEALAQAATEASVFARVTPEQKYRIIAALKQDHVVGYQGDGINDAPPLKLADVGIAVDSATDVAKASADIILLNKDLGVIVHGIQYGRSIFVNINKYIKYTMVGNFGNYIALSALYLLSTGLPLLPRQVLLISLLTDVPLVTISTDTVEDAEVQRPEKQDVHSLMFLTLVLGTLTALFELAFFATLKLRGSGFAETSLFLFLSFTQLVVIFSIRNKDHFWKARLPSRPLLAAIAVTFVVTLALPYIGPIAALFAFTALPVGELAIIIAMTALYVVVLDVVKVWYFQAFPHPAPAQVETATRPPLASGAGRTSTNGFGQLLMRVRDEVAGR
jgi:P-type Mg2+ transporter